MTTDSSSATSEVGPDCGVPAADSRPIWWRATDGDPPAAWVERFDVLTSDAAADQYGRAAGIFISRVRRRTGQGPTFSELFHELFEVGALHPEWPPNLDWLTRRSIRGSYRLHVAIQWKRRGWISWDPRVTRSLRVGRVFREHARAWQAAKTQ